MPFGIADIAAVVGAGATVYGALNSSNAATDAANTQANAANQANATQLQMFNTNQANMAPWMQAGQVGLSQLRFMMGQTGTGDPSQPGFGQFLKPFSPGDLQNDPGYQFNLNQGMQAINQQAAARGNYYSPATLQNLSQFAQGTASNEYMNAYNRYNQDYNQIFNRLNATAGMGLNAAGGVAGLGANAANQIGQNQIGAGNALAAGQVGSANALSGGVNSLYNQYLMNQMLSQNQQSSNPSYVPYGQSSPYNNAFDNPANYG